MLDEDSKTFVVQIAALEALLVGMTIYLSQVAQITVGDPVQVTAL